MAYDVLDGNGGTMIADEPEPIKFTNPRGTLRAWLKEPSDAHTAEEWLDLSFAISEYLDDEDLSANGRREIERDSIRARDMGRMVAP